jgi:ribosome biogenesis GTPase
MKKKDKKKFKRRNIRFKNIDIDELDYFEEEDIQEEKRAEKKIPDKAKSSQKSDLKLYKGRILEITTNYKCCVKMGKKVLECFLSGRLKQINYETKNLVAPGDWVNVDLSEYPRIEEILPRKNSLSRFTESGYQQEIVIASNVDQVIITTSWRNPELKPGLIDRYICAAYLQNIEPIVCVNKIDLCTKLAELDKIMNFYKKLKILVVYTSAIQKRGIEELKRILQGKDSVFSGHSGAGKSSLLNCLQPDLQLKVANTSNSTGKGIHTTTKSRLIPWDFGGYLIDTPGIKTFNLKKEDKDKLPRIFPGFPKLYSNCKFPDCTHTHETDCAVKKAVEKKQFPLARYESYLRIIQSLL